MSHSTELSDLVARHLQGKVSLNEKQIREATIELNQLVLKIREGESTIHGAIDKFFGGGRG